MAKAFIFKDRFVENEYKNSQIRIHQKSFLILTIGLVLQSSLIYFLNPLELNVFEPKCLMTFLLGISAIISVYVLIRTKFPKHSEKGISIFVFSFTMCCIEFIHVIQSSVHLASWVYVVLGINIQTGCLFLLMSQVSRIQSFLITSVVHIYSWLRVIDIVNSTGAQKATIISLATHFLLFFTLKYIYGKELKISVEKIRENCQQLSSFDEVIESLMTCAIIILKNDKLIFMNDASKDILDICKRKEVNEILKKIEVIICFI